MEFIISFRLIYCSISRSVLTQIAANQNGLSDEQLRAEET